MRKLLLLTSIVLLEALPRLLGAQEPARTFCQDTPANDCPGEDCLCVDDTLEVVFAGDLTSSIFEYDDFTPGLRVPTLVMLDVRTDQIQGFSYGVAHDEAKLSLVRVDIQQPPEEEGDCLHRRICLVPGGYTVAAISCNPQVVLPLGRLPSIHATYTLLEDVGQDGTPLRFTESLCEPPVEVAITVSKLTFPDMVEDGERNCVNGADDDGDGLTDRDDGDCVVYEGVPRKPRTLVDGLIRRRESPPAFRRADADGNGRFNISDAILVIQGIFGAEARRFDCVDLLDTNDDGRLNIADGIPLLRHLFMSGPPLQPPFETCGPDPTADAFACVESNCAP